MEIYNGMRQWIAARRQHKAGQTEAFLRLEADETAQICEFSGKLCITIHGTPVIDCGQLKGSPLEALGDIRTNIYQYLKNKQATARKRTL